jgi:hypothetical protein
MFKNLIAPVQAWLLKSGKCVGCGTSLTEGSSTPSTKVKGVNQITCKCQRVYLLDPKSKKYRRALLSQI